MLTTQEIAKANQELKNLHPQKIVEWAYHLAPMDTIVSTHFGPQESVILHLCHQVNPQMPVLWADTGHHTRYTYAFAYQLIQKLSLNMHIYVPKTTLGFQDAVYGGIPGLEDKKKHDVFTREVKLEPFERGLFELKPKIWITAIRKEQTAFRNQLDIVSLSKSGVLKVSPVFYWTDADMDAYMQQFSLPNEKRYFDPTKVDSKRECGLHPGV